MNFFCNINQSFSDLLINYLNLIKERSSCLEVLFKKDVFRNFAKFLETPFFKEYLRWLLPKCRQSFKFLKGRLYNCKNHLMKVRQSSFYYTRKLETWRTICWDEINARWLLWNFLTGWFPSKILKAMKQLHAWFLRFYIKVCK